MNSDIRLSVDFFSHPKTIKLIRRLGADGVLCLQKLWLFAAKHRADGRFVDMDSEEMEIAAGWTNEYLTNRSTVVNGVNGFVDTLVELRWLDVVNGVYELHGWLDNNGYAASADDRSDKSRFSRMAKTHPQIYSDLKAQGFSAISSNYYKKLTTPVRVNIGSAEADALHFEDHINETVVNESLNESLTNRSSPLPSPSPSLKDIASPKSKRVPSGDHQLFLDWWYMAFERVSGSKPRVDGKLLNLTKSLLAGVDNVKQLVCYASVVLTEENKFYDEAGRTLGVLSSQLEAFKSRKNNYDVPLWREYGIAPPDGVKFEDWKFWENTDDQP